jgi:hypothetical protein
MFEDDHSEFVSAINGQHDDQKKQKQEKQVEALSEQIEQELM